MAKSYATRSQEELSALKKELEQEYEAIKGEKLSLNMARGKPSREQINFSLPLLDLLTSETDLPDDYANYGMIAGIPEAKRLMANLLEVDVSDVFLGGNSSLNMMHDCFSLGYTFGFPESESPWAKQETVKFLCPSPGYDRHFAITEHFGVTLVPVEMTATGPNMDEVESLIKDPKVKGMWCVPKYSNPTGVTYSDETVCRLADLSPASPDFKLFWDNAYTVHHLNNNDPDQLLNIMIELRKNNKEHMILMFSSTSKLTFPGAGISAIAGGKTTMDWINHHFSKQTISYDKLNMLRHALFLPNPKAVADHMANHGTSLAPKFDIVCDSLATMDDLGIASWRRPKGGYFVSLDVPKGCAKRVVSLCGEAGVLLTPAGATHPYGNDPADRTIRIAPSFPPVEELKQAMDLLVLCTKLAAVERLEQ